MSPPPEDTDIRLRGSSGSQIFVVPLPFSWMSKASSVLKNHARTQSSKMGPERSESRSESRRSGSHSRAKSETALQESQNIVKLGRFTVEPESPHSSLNPEQLAAKHAALADFEGPTKFARRAMKLKHPSLGRSISDKTNLHSPKNNHEKSPEFMFKESNNSVRSSPRQPKRCATSPAQSPLHRSRFHIEEIPTNNSDSIHRKTPEGGSPLSTPKTRTQKTQKGRFTVEDVLTDSPHSSSTSQSHISKHSQLSNAGAKSPRDAHSTKTNGRPNTPTSPTVGVEAGGSPIKIHRKGNSKTLENIAGQQLPPTVKRRAADLGKKRGSHDVTRVRQPKSSFKRASHDVTLNYHIHSNNRVSPSPQKNIKKKLLLQETDIVSPMVSPRKGSVDGFPSSPPSSVLFRDLGLDPQNVGNWSAQDVSKWLRSLGKAYGDFCQSFENSGVDGELLLGFSTDAEQGDQMLEELGVEKKIHRKKIKQKVEKLIRLREAAKQLHS